MTIMMFVGGLSWRSPSNTRRKVVRSIKQNSRSDSSKSNRLVFISIISLSALAVVDILSIGLEPREEELSNVPNWRLKHDLKEAVLSIPADTMCNLLKIQRSGLG